MNRANQGNQLAITFWTEKDQQEYEMFCNQLDLGKARGSLDIGLNSSNIWKVLLLNQLRSKTATIQELDQLGRSRLGILQNFYVDAPAVVLRSVSDSHRPNDYLARQLAGLIQVGSLNAPLIIEGLGIRKDSSSEYGLSFIGTERLRVIEAPAFSPENNGRKFDGIDPDYKITFSPSGKRTLLTRGEGLSRLFYSQNFCVNSSEKDLSTQGSNGRILLVDHYLNGIRKTN